MQLTPIDLAGVVRDSVECVRKAIDGAPIEFAGGRISVTLRAVSGAAELAVSDVGIGVSADEREKLFTGLYRISRARDRAIPAPGSRCAEPSCSGTTARSSWSTTRVPARRSRCGYRSTPVDFVYPVPRQGRTS